MYSVDYEKLFREISPAFFQQYLQENGWTPFKTKREDVSVFQYIQDAQFEQVEIPRDRALFDYESTLYQAVKTVASVEGKTIDQVLWTLLGQKREKIGFQCAERDPGVQTSGLLREKLEQMLLGRHNDELAAAAAESQEQILSDWMGGRQQAVRQELKYDSALLTYIERFLKSLDASLYAVLRPGTWLGTVESLERLQYEQNQTEWAEERFAKAYVKHLSEVVKALETHGAMSHTELSEFLGMEASALTEAMKKIVDTGAVQVSGVGKYKLYSLSDEELRYEKEL